MMDKSKMPVNKIKLNRSQIREGLKQIPIESIIGGEGKKRSLTKKQLGFIKDVALGKPKAQAYRDNYNTKASPKVVGNDASKLASKPVISMEVEAFKVALLAREYQRGDQLKAFIMHQLTLHALNEENPANARINALKLLGQSYDVGLFVDRKEITTINNTIDVKAKLIEQIKNAISKNNITIDYNQSGDSLLAELNGVSPIESGQFTTHDTHTPEDGRVEEGSGSHTIPLNQSHNRSHNQSTENTSENNKLILQSVDLEGEKDATANACSWGEGVEENSEEGKGEVLETPPIGKLDKKG